MIPFIRILRGGAEKGKPAGFTLIEVLVAIALMGLGLTATLRLVGHQGQVQREVTQRLEALRVAQSTMEGFLEGPKLKVGDYKGRSGNRIAWEVEVARLDEDPQDAGSPGASRRLSRRVPLLLSVNVCVYWTEENKKRSLCLSSQRTSER